MSVRSELSLQFCDVTDATLASPGGTLRARKAGRLLRTPSAVVFHGDMDDRRSGWWQALTGVIDQSHTATGDDLAQLLSEAADGSV